MKMKKQIAGIIVLTVLYSLAGCGNTGAQDEAAADTTAGSAAEAAGQDSSQAQENEAAPAAAGTNDDGVVDLTALSSTMVYSEVYNMLVTPEDYIGKTVKMDGAFAVYEGDSRNYYACIIADATSCCSQGIEFEWDGQHSYPEDYPELGSEITVQGIFDTYEEDGNLYCHLVDAEVASAK